MAVMIPSKFRIYPTFSGSWCITSRTFKDIAEAEKILDKIVKAVPEVTKEKTGKW